jgi:hypothetical protein
LARFAADQRHTLLAAYLPDLSTSLTDQTLDMLDKILDELVRKGNKKQNIISSRTCGPWAPTWLC